MASPQQVGDILAEDWERHKRDGVAFFDPQFDELTASEIAAIGERLCDDYERDVVAIQARIRRAKRPFIVDWPALAAWRDGVLRDTRRHPALVVAAALEAMAIECELAGYAELAQKARAQAEAVVIGRRAQPEAGAYAP